MAGGAGAAGGDLEGVPGEEGGEVVDLQGIGGVGWNRFEWRVTDRCMSQVHACIRKYVRAMYE